MISRLPSLASAAVVALGVLLVARGSLAQEKPLYKDPKQPVETRVNDLLSRMTLAEKVAQLQSTLRKIEWGKNITEDGLGGIGPLLRPLTAADAARKANEYQKMALEKTRLGIPIMIHDEALHGLIGNGATSFPQSIALAATWDPLLMQRIGAVIGRETRSRGIRQVLAPVINIARDARWGRVEETYGEDPYLQSRMAVAYCKTIEKEGVLTTPKHFVANYGDGGRDSYPVALTERELREVYLPPFKAAIQEAGASSVMASYNSLDGLPCSAHPWLLTQLLRKEWGFRGFVVSDYGSVGGIKDFHAVAATDKETARKAVEAGLDVELPDIYYFGPPLLAAANESRVTAAAVDEAVRRVLRSKFDLGLFDDPYVKPEVAAAMAGAGEHRTLAREAECKAIVLLKNDGGLLPLRKDLASIAVIGPLADSVALGGYSGSGMECVTILQGIRKAVGPGVNVSYEKGCTVGIASYPPIPGEFLIPPDAKPGEHGLRGEYFPNKDLYGAPSLVRIDALVNFTWPGAPAPGFPEDHFSVRWTGKLAPTVSGTYQLGAATDDGVRLWLDGKLLIDSWVDRGTTLDRVTVKLEGGRQYDLKMEYYENIYWGAAGLVWRLETGVDDRIKAAEDAARKAKAALVVVGISEGEGNDRSSLDLPGEQERLIAAVAGTGTPTVVLLVNGSAVTMKKWIDGVPAVLECWYGGEEAGNAIADVLFGATNPGGKLPITFPQVVGQVPLFYNAKPTGRADGYVDMSGKPLFPFGHGLSYTTFAYSDLRLTPGKVTPDASCRVSLSVRNSGSVTGDEVVQLYIRRPVASVTRPVKELKGFTRITLAPGETKTVEFTLSPAELAFLDAAMKEVVEPGKVNVMVGASSADIRLRGTLEIAGP